MNAINDLLLNLFTGSDKNKPALMFPNMINGIVYASDANVLIAIPEEELALKYTNSDKYPNAKKLLSELNNQALLSTKVNVEELLKQLTQCRLKVDKIFVECDECNGDGEVEWEYEDNNGKTHYLTQDCPVCNGEGEIDKKHPFAKIKISSQDKDGNNIYIQIGELSFRPFDIYRLAMVAVTKGYKEIELLHTRDGYGQTLTIFGNIKIMLMSLPKNF